jgi:hypothetical protein
MPVYTVISALRGEGEPDRRIATGCLQVREKVAAEDATKT